MSYSTLSKTESIHQSYESFSEVSRRRQCSFVSFTSLLCAQSLPAQQWSTDTINTVTGRFVRLGTKRLGYETSWYESSWYESSWYETSWVRNVLGTKRLGYETSGNHAFHLGSSIFLNSFYLIFVHYSILPKLFGVCTIMLHYKPQGFQ